MEVSDRRMFFDDLFEAFTMLAVGNYVSLYDVNDHITRYSESAVNYFGLPGEYIADGAYDWTDYIHPDDRARYTEIMGSLLKMEKRVYDLVYRVKNREGDYAAFRFVGALLRDSEGEGSFVGGMMINEGVTENIDSITVFRNRNGFMSDLDLMLETKKPGDILLIGFNGLSRLNERYGYGYGNMALQQIGWTIQESLAYEGVVYRLQDGIYAVILPDGEDHGVEALYAGIRQRFQTGISIGGVRQSFVINGTYFRLTEFSVSPVTIYNNLMFGYGESKKRKHGQLVPVNHGETGEGREMDLVDRVRRCMLDECRGFYLKYQKVRDFTAGRVSGVEALLRWADDDYGEILPGEFLPVLERDIAYEELGYWILRRVLDDGREFLKKRPACVIGFNISPFQLEDDYFLPTLLVYAEERAFPVDHLAIELTKECRYLDTALLTERVAAFREKGIRVILDDFGSGFGSLELLRRMEVDTVKFDIEYTAGIDSDASARNDLACLVGMVRGHGLRACVKGVETASLYEAAAAMDVDLMQGNCLSEPVLFADLEL
ncbi:MAG: EAL domain-containing protein [Bacillota bacterium]|jgi:EAL domain-containing protein (putative c-di-GMP-specific phosphodiesterase class I)/GGDEF domain-containing protein